MPNKRPADEGAALQLVYYAYLAASRFVLALPERLAYALADVAGLAKRRITRRQAAGVARNLARITGRPVDSPEVSKLLDQAYRSYARYWLETFRIAREGRDFFLDRFRCTTDDRIEEVLARGKGAIVVVGHLGNYDAAGAWAASKGWHLVTVAEVIKPRRLFDFFVRHREKLGMTIHPARKGVTADLAAAVEEGAVVAILGDRDLKGTGIEVKLFGESTTLPAGAASIALRTGVPLLVAGVYGEVFEGGKRGWSATISEPIELPQPGGSEAVQELTQQVAAKLEEFIARRPEEWHVFQPFWVSDRSPAPDASEMGL